MAAQARNGVDATFFASRGFPDLAQCASPVLAAVGYIANASFGITRVVAGAQHERRAKEQAGAEPRGSRRGQSG